MTLNDFEMPFLLTFVFTVGLARFLCLDFRDNYAKTNEDTPILSETKMFAGHSSFWWYKIYADIRYCSRTMRSQLTVDWSKAVNLQCH